MVIMADHAPFHGIELGILSAAMGLWMSGRIVHVTVEATVVQNAPSEAVS